MYPFDPQSKVNPNIRINMCIKRGAFFGGGGGAICGISFHNGVYGRDASKEISPTCG